MKHNKGYFQLRLKKLLVFYEFQQYLATYVLRRRP